MSEWLVLTLAMAAVCAVVVLVTTLRHRRVGDDDDPSETPDVIEYMTMMIGVVYAIVLGLAIAGVWEARNAAEDHVRAEAQALHEVSERVRIYPADVRDRIRADVDAYVGHVTTTEWQSMADRGELTDEGARLLDRVRHAVTDYEPADEFEAQAYQPLMDQVMAADQARGARADSTEATIAGRGLVRADHRRAGDPGDDLRPPDPADGPGVDPRRALLRPDRLPALPDLGLRRAVQPGVATSAEPFLELFPHLDR